MYMHIEIWTFSNDNFSMASDWYFQYVQLFPLLIFISIIFKIQKYLLSGYYVSDKIEEGNFKL